jgi:hypothetical protein
LVPPSSVLGEGSETDFTIPRHSAHHGLLRMLSYILQAMSADREFGVALNKPLSITVPVKWSVQGSTADFMIVVCFRDVRKESKVELTIFNTSVNVLHCHDARSQPPLPRLDCNHQQCGPLLERPWCTSFHPLASAIQGVLGAKLFASRRGAS